MEVWGYGIWGIRLSTLGNVISPRFKISSGLDYNNIALDPPGISYNGANYLVTWSEFVQYPYHEELNLSGSRCSPQGYDLDTTDIIICKKQNDQYEPQTVSSDSNYLVFWTDERYDSLPHCTRQIYAILIAPDGTVLDTNGIALTPQLSECKSPDIARSGGSKYLLVYSKFTDYPHGSYRIFGEFVTPAVGVTEKEQGTAFVTMLRRNYPNPFSKSTTICFQIRKKAFVALSIYDTAGRLVKCLVNEQRNPGIYLSTWDGKDSHGRTVSNGIYFYKPTADAFSETRKMILLR
jgi:hypothetical protein